ncbi:MAG: SDR family oxidoreductase [Gammaproteobacteria bacterium]
MGGSLETNNSVLIIGCGDIGQRVAALHRQQGDSVSALARTVAGATHLQAQGIAVLAGDLDDPHTLSALPVSDALVYYFAPPPEAGMVDPRMANFIAALNLEHAPNRLVYLSTSGVYGDCQGAWVTEDTPPRPQTARAKARLAAEQTLTDWSKQQGADIVILRVGGIYGPGRLPVARIKEGLPVVRSEECPYTNRIHADDLARVCLVAAECGKSGAIYNVCDGEPSTMTDYFNGVADRLGLSRPPAISLAEAQRVLTPGMLSYLNESRRMDNRRMREELDVTLLYPNLQAGLAASI